MNEKTQRLCAFLAGAALAAALIVLVVLALSAHVVTVHEGYENYPMNELVVFWRDNPLLSMAGTAAAIAAMMGMCALVKKGKRLHLDKLLFVLWMAVTAAWLWGAGVTPHADSKQVVEASKLFAVGDYSRLSTQYFSDYSFQLGFCLLLETVARLFPWADLVGLMQLLNAAMCAGMAVAMGMLFETLADGRDDRSACAALYLLLLPMPFYCTYVYGTIPMLFFSALALLHFVHFARRGRAADGWLYTICIAAAVLLKPNAMIELIALCIISVLIALREKNGRVLCYSAAAAALCVLLPKMVVCFYELRSGITLSGDISMLARLVMGFQRSATGAGWFNNYTERFSTTIMEPQAARVILLADLRQIFSDFAAAPGTLIQFLAEKCASLWLEPTYSVLWYGAVSDVTGRFNGLANMVYLETGALRLPLERVMDVFQQALYLLACIGIAGLLKKRRDPVQILLPVIVLGGFLYHLLFEAKSQYIFVYAFFLTPLAAQGMCMLEAFICKKWKNRKKDQKA